MEFIDEALSDYCIEHTDAEPPLLETINRETHLKVMSPRMLSGHLQGRFLSFISKIHKPTIILEIGTYTGYSALCLAEGLTEKGKLFTIDPNEETNKIAKGYFDKSDYKNKIELLSGDAGKIIRDLKYELDIVFIDADKQNYPLYFDLVIDKIKKGGLIIADNVLWSGKVIQPKNLMDKDTQAINDFNKKVSEDKRVSHLLLPVRDGLMLLIKN